MMKKLSLLLILFILLAVFVQTAVAKGPMQIVGIAWPGSSETIWIEDPAMLEHLSMAAFEDFYQAVQFPVKIPVSGGIEINRYYQENELATPVQFDKLFYFRSTESEPGYVYYYGLVNGWSEYDGHWYRVKPKGEQVLLDVLKANGFEYPELNPGEVVAAKPEQAAFAIDAAQAGLLAVGVVAGASAGWGLARAASKNRK
jgi:hypothetical protein